MIMMTKKEILITGGAGYVGSHTVLALARTECNIVVIDNLHNSFQESLRRIERITKKTITLLQGDIRDECFLNQVFSTHNIDTVFHFAGLKAVGESIVEPTKYYDNNVAGSITLIKAMQLAKVFTLLFSSSSTVYGNSDIIPLTEELPFGVPLSPYGASKQMVEQILCDLPKADSRWKIASLRYFNPIGADASGKIGENTVNTPHNLLPCISQVAAGKRDEVLIFGNDYPTPDGTCIRDYIHVTDVASGHLAALDYLVKSSGYYVWNLGTGRGYSVLDVIKMFEKISGVTIPYRVVPRRAGDIPLAWANADKACQELGWRAKFDLSHMLVDAWHWQKNAPDGYSS